MKTDQKGRRVPSKPSPTVPPPKKPTSGLVAYDLVPPAKVLPMCIFTRPLDNRILREA